MIRILSLPEVDFFPDCNRPHLDGRHGKCRSPKKQLLKARNDSEAIEAFLSKFTTSPATQRAYKREIERLRLWAARERVEPISSLKAEDIQAYYDFLKNIPAEWIGKRNCSRGSKDWRPFVGQLKESSIRQAMVTVMQLYNYLVDSAYLVGNPCFQLKGRFKGTSRSYEARRRVEQRIMQDDHWNLLVDHLDSLPELLNNERTRFIIAMLHFLGLRIDELGKGKMCDFEWRPRQGGQWFFYVRQGKGNKSREIPVPAALLESLYRWRKALGLPQAPMSGEETAIIRRIDSDEGLKVRRISDLIKNVIVKASESLPEDEAKIMQKASAHWFRHGQFTEHENHDISIEDTARIAGHSSINTSRIYRHGDADRQHELVQNIGWRRKVRLAHNIAYGNKK